jgi:uncharacterized protein YbjT (DUF2867 family)
VASHHGGPVHIGPVFHPDETRPGVSMVEAAARAGVRDFVFSGVVHPANGLPNHAAKLPVEQTLGASGMRYRTLAQCSTLWRPCKTTLTGGKGP